jgi:hypothetical protein
MVIGTAKMFLFVICLTKLGIEMYANTRIGNHSHHGNYGWTGTFKDVLKKKDGQ